MSIYLKKKQVFRTFFLLTCLAYFSVFSANSQDEQQNAKVTTAADTTAADSSGSANVVVHKDSVHLLQPKRSKDALDAPVHYSAQDSIVFYGDGRAFLYGKATVKYEKMELASDNIKLNMDSSIVQARGGKDSTGADMDLPVFTEGKDSYESKCIDYNFKSKKGLIRGVVTQQGDGYITSDKAKKLDDDVFLMKDGKYTTCSEHDHPHFYINMTKAKVKPKEFVVAGPAYLVILDVPIPLMLPFGYFPFTDKYSSGLLMPSYGEESSRGFYLKDGGYYFALSDYFDLAVRGDIYTKGSWGINGTSRYKKRYKYNGNFYISYQKTVDGEKTLKEYTESGDLKITWRHTQDPKANPFSTLSASVNFSTSSYNKNNLDSYYKPSLYGENNKSSSINYSYKFPESPFSLSTNMTVNQRQSDSTLSVSFPNVYLTMSRVYPFKKKVRVGKEKWFEKIHLNYKVDFNNNITTKQDKPLGSSEMKDFKKWNNGFRHQLSTGASYNLFKYLIVSPGASYNEKWYFKRVGQEWDEKNQAIRRDTTTGFYRLNDFNAKIDFSTQLYGFFKPLIGKKISMIRHVFQPTVGFSWSPEIDRFEPSFGSSKNMYYSYYNRPNPAEPGLYNPVKYSYYQGAVFGAPSSGGRGYLNFGMTNNLEMKVNSTKDSTGYKKISLIDNLSANASYNMFADSLNWSDISTSVRFKVTKNVNLTVTANFTPYTYRLNEYNVPTKSSLTEWQKNGRIARLTSAQTSFGYSFNNDTFKKKNKKDNSSTHAEEKSQYEQELEDEMYTPKKETKKSDSEGVDEQGYQKFSLPWNFRFDYSIAYSDYEFDKRRLKFKKRVSQALNFSGSITFTKNWNFNFSSGYDFDNRKIAYSSCGISRNLHCWSASLNLVPFGDNKSYNFVISASSSLLQDLKYEQRSNPSDNPIWY